MKFKQQAALFTVAGAVILAIGCAHEPKQANEAAMEKTSQATAQSGGGHFVVVDFAKGGKSLDEGDKEKLRKLAAEAPHQGKIKEYEVLAWADREYPTDGQKATSQEADLAEGRADVIKNFLKKDLSTTESVDTHNMAKRPGAVADLFKTDDYKTKNNFQGTGAAPDDHATAVNKIENKASKAVIFVKYE